MHTKPRVVVVAGFSSNCGKTTLACRLLERSPGWEAIKVTKGHYRSCGKDPHACCVSHLLSDAPLVMSGRRATYVENKDTGKFWDAGAANVHWVVATKEQVGDGVREALSRVAPECAGVVVEGTGLLRTVAADCSVMVTGTMPRELKSSAASVLSHVDALYVACSNDDLEPSLARIRELLERRRVATPLPPIFSDDDLPALFDLLGNTVPA